jgi:hypothetical protein
MIAGVKVVFWRFVQQCLGCDCDWCMCATGKIRNNNGNKATTGNKQGKIITYFTTLWVRFSIKAIVIAMLEKVLLFVGLDDR